MERFTPAMNAALKDVVQFAEEMGGLKLRSYQAAVARAVTRSVIEQQGLTFVVVFPRQSGKNEVQAQIETYLLTSLARIDTEIVKVSPTWKPQSLNAMRRLERALNNNVMAMTNWSKESGYIYRIGKARVYFLSGSPTTNIVGATASTLLEVDEAQDILPSKYDKDIAPMAASTNATRVLWGTAWTSRTLLARELRAARQAERADGVRRAFVLTAEEVAIEVPAYGQFVAEQVRRLGRSHPMVRTQYFSEEIDAQGGMFPPARLALLRGEHARRHAPQAGALYALLLDVAGEDEGRRMEAWGEESLANPQRDATALTVVEVDLSTLEDALLRLPTYRVVDRKSWVGEKHSTLYGQIRALGEHWRASYLVVDATGVGAGLASFLERAFPGRVIPFTFNSATKSRMGWELLAMVDAGRFKEWERGEKSAMSQVESARRHVPGAREDEQGEFFRQLEHCEMEVVVGPERRMKWGVPDGTKDARTGERVHDDWVLSAALATALDGMPWAVSAPAVVIRGKDPLEEMDRGF